MRIGYVALLTLLPAVAGTAHADPLQDQVLAGMKAANTADVGFTRTMRVEQTGGEGHSYVSRYDPRAAQRWTLVQVDGRAATAKETAEAARQTKADKVPSYASLAEWFGSPATRVAQTPGSITYRFARLPAGVIRISGHDASADTVIDAVVNTGGKAPYVERVRFVSETPFRLKLVARIERYVLTGAYAPLADGRPFPQANDMEIAGSLFGKSGSIRTRIRYADARGR